MEKPSYKARKRLAIGYLIWAAVVIVFTIACAKHELRPWVIILSTTVAILSFALFVILLKDNETPKIVIKKTKKTKRK